MRNHKWLKGLILFFFLSTVGIGVEWKKIKESYELAQIVKKDEECEVKADEKEKRLLHLYEEKKEEEARKLEKEIREDFGKIIELYEEFLSLYPNNKKAWNFLGLLYFQRLKDPERAKECWEKALSIDPNYAPALNNLSTYYSHTGNHLQSIKLIQKAIENNPNVAVYHFNLSLYYFLFRYEVKEKLGWSLEEIFWKAIEEGEKARNLDPTNFDFAKHVAELYRFAPYFGVNPSSVKVIQEWEKVLKIAKTPQQKGYVYLNIGRIYAIMGEKEKAIQAFEKAKVYQPSPGIDKWLEKLKNGKNKTSPTR